MNVRTTPQVAFQRSGFDLARSYSRLARVQGQLSSLKRIQTLSDDPARGTRALDARQSLARTARIRENLAIAREASTFQSSTLETISNLIASAREKAQQAGDGANGPAELDVIATEIDSILAEIVTLANQSTEGRYLFAGSQVDHPPFSVSKSDGSITGVHYTGDDLVRQIRLGPGELLDTELSGLEVFFSTTREATVISGNTGLKSTAGKGDTAIGSLKIAFAHTATTLGDGLAPGGGDSVSGIAAGASSAADTILGDHTLTVATDSNGNGVISLDDGTEVAFDGTETDLLLTNDSGDTIHVDVTGLGGGFNGTVAVHGDGTIQVGDQAAVALTFANDVSFTDAGGRVIHLDTTAVQRTGEASAVFPGTESIFDVLIGLRDDLRGDAGFDPGSVVDRIQGRVSAIDTAHDGLLVKLSKLGGLTGSFERIDESLSLFEVTLEEKRSALEDTDIFAASVELAQAESAHQAALQVTARIASLPNLGNFLF